MTKKNSEMYHTNTPSILTDTKLEYQTIKYRWFNNILSEKKKKQNEEELQKLHGKLEQLVEARTVELRQAKELAEASAKAKTDCLSSMSHEIRTPFNTIMGMVDMIMDTDLSPEQRKYFNIIQSSSRLGLQLLNDALDFSKMDSGKLDFENIPFSLREIISEVSDMFQEAALKKKIRLLTKLSPGVPLQIVSDSLRLKQILINLVSNALKFTKKGEITISVDECIVTKDLTELLFSVRDTGLGIAPEAMDTIFGAYIQADVSTSRQYGGSGLGLAICEKLVTMMGGDIWVKSEPGIGSTFFFSLCFKPVHPEKVWPLSEPSAIEKRTPVQKCILQDVNILLAEDNSVNQIVVKTILESAGMNVYTADNGLEAVQIIKENYFDAILMDIQMPGMNGLEATKVIRNELGFDNIPIIAMTGLTLTEDREKCLEAGMVGYISKPINRNNLFDIIKKNIAGLKQVNSGEKPLME